MCLTKSIIGRLDERSSILTLFHLEKRCDHFVYQGREHQLMEAREPPRSYRYSLSSISFTK